MATLKEVQDKADAKLVQFWQELQTRQTNYHNNHGKYFQLLVTGGRGVENGEEHDFTLRPASDEPFIADIDFTWTEQLPFEIRVDEWAGTIDKGYTATVWVEFTGTIYSRSRDSENNDTGWFNHTAIIDNVWL